MKIRIKGNSLRLRLTRSDVDMLAAKGSVQEKINFGEAALQYSLCSTTDNRLSAAFRANQITVYFPAAWMIAWISTDKVGYEHRMTLENGELLHLLVEKDFTCLDNVQEDQRDNYPNPLLKKQV